MSEWKKMDSLPKSGEFLVLMPNSNPKVQGAYRTEKGLFVIGGAFHFDVEMPSAWIEAPIVDGFIGQS